MLDIHAHLYWKSYDMDRDAVVERAHQAGVSKMICVGTEPEDNPLAIGVAEKYEDIFASVGIHPHYFNESGIPARPAGGKNQESREETSIHDSQFTIPSGEKKRIKELMENLRKIARHPKVVAIGECGLDYFSRDSKRPITDVQKAAQKEGFIAQLELAQELKLPVIIHCRDAYQEMHEVLENHNSQFPILDSRFILHCYQGDTEITKKFLELPNIYFSFAGNITYPVKKALVGTKDDLTETVKLVPVERLFVETDCPFLAPQSKRGKRNEPALVIETAELLASMKGLPRDELERALGGNFAAVFGKTTDVL